MGINDGIKETQHAVDAFLMIGQSNMAGRGDFGEVPDIRNPLCYMLRMGRWQPMSDPVNPDRAIYGIRFHSGVSLATSFADCYAKEYDRAVGLIPCADGGTGVDEWKKGELLFDHAVMQTELAKRTSCLKGIIWHQGETDCRMDDEAIEKYPEKLIEFVKDLRETIGAEDVPFIAGEISEDIPEHWKMGDKNIIFNKNLHELKKYIPNFDVVSSQGLELKADGIHFTSKSCREFGKRYFEVYKNMI